MFCDYAQSEEFKRDVSAVAEKRRKQQKKFNIFAVPIMVLMLAAVVGMLMIPEDQQSGALFYVCIGVLAASMVGFIALFAIVGGKRYSALIVLEEGLAKGQAAFANEYLDGIWESAVQGNTLKICLNITETNSVECIAGDKCLRMDLAPWDKITKNLMSVPDIYGMFCYSLFPYLEKQGAMGRGYDQIFFEYTVCGRPCKMRGQLSAQTFLRKKGKWTRCCKNAKKDYDRNLQKLK